MAISITIMGHLKFMDSETAMGEKMDVQHNPDTPYLRARNTVISIIGMRFFKAWMQPDALFKLTSYSKLQKENIDLTHKFTDEVSTQFVYVVHFFFLDKYQVYSHLFTWHIYRVT